MTKSKRTEAALKALKAKRNIPDGVTKMQIMIQLPDEFVGRLRSLSPVKRGEIIAEGLKAINAEIEKNMELTGKLARSIVKAHELNVEKAIDSIQIKQ